MYGLFGTIVVLWFLCKLIPNKGWRNRVFSVAALVIVVISASYAYYISGMTSKEFREFYTGNDGK